MFQNFQNISYSPKGDEKSYESVDRETLKIINIFYIYTDFDKNISLKKLLEMISFPTLRIDVSKISKVFLILSHETRIQFRATGIS